MQFKANETFKIMSMNLLHSIHFWDIDKKYKKGSRVLL